MFNLKINKTFTLPITQLFDAFHKPELISQWIAPEPMQVVQVVSDFEEGGQYRIVMEDISGKSHLLTGEYTRIRRNDQLMFSWAWSKSLEDNVITSVDIQFEELKDSTTEIFLIHSGFANEKEKEKQHLSWVGCLEKLSTIRFH